jgi:hypothetical protein
MNIFQVASQLGLEFLRDQSLAHYFSLYIYIYIYIYINDIPQLTQGRLIMYADDTSILTRGQDINELQNKMTKNIGVAEQYFTMNKLPVNPLKTHYILFHIKQYRLESNLKILVKNREIQNVRSTNFLV